MRNFCSISLGVLTMTASLATAQSGDAVVHQLPQDNSMIRVEQVAATDTAITGRVINLGDRRIERVELLANDTFLWTDDHHPGPQDPGGATHYTLPEPVPPHGSVLFRIARPLPSRSDGHFVTDVTIVQFVAQDAEHAAQ